MIIFNGGVLTKGRTSLCRLVDMGSRIKADDKDNDNDIEDNDNKWCCLEEIFFNCYNNI